MVCSRNTSAASSAQRRSCAGPVRHRSSIHAGWRYRRARTGSSGSPSSSDMENRSSGAAVGVAFGSRPWLDAHDRAGPPRHPPWRRRCTASMSQHLAGRMPADDERAGRRAGPPDPPRCVIVFQASDLGRTSSRSRDRSVVVSPTSAAPTPSAMAIATGSPWRERRRHPQPSSWSRSSSIPAAWAISWITVT